MTERERTMGLLRTQDLFSILRVSFHFFPDARVVHEPNNILPKWWWWQTLTKWGNVPQMIEQMIKDRHQIEELFLQLQSIL